MIMGEPMKSEYFKSVKEELLRRRAELLREVSEAYATCRELGQDGVADIGDMSANAYSRDVLFNLSEAQRQQIRDIDVAIERIDNGQYGTCMNCGEEIAQRRLEVRPFSRYCIECKTDIEKFGA